MADQGGIVALEVDGADGGRVGGAIVSGLTTLQAF